MLFVPVVPPTPPAPPSPRVRELSDLLGRVISEYEKHHPNITGQEVRQALEIASRGSKAAGAAAHAVALGVGAALAVAGGLVFLLMARSGGDAASVPWVSLAWVGLSVLAVAILLKRLSGR